jgi:AmmeMemoRadiSam system protein A
MITLEQGKRLIKLARGSISCYFSGEEVKIDDVKKEFSEVLGVFVTLNKGGELRGCIGFPEGIFPLYEGVVKAARNAAFSDLRFVPVEKGELKDISIEVSVLTKPDRVNVEKA